MESYQQKMHYKEKTPQATVHMLKQILAEHGIETEEEWQDESSISTFTVRVTLKGTDIGANGKGISRDYSLASGYAEFFERYQNNMLAQSVPTKEKLENLWGFTDGKSMTAEEILDQNSAFMEMYFNKRGMNKASYSERVEAFRTVNKDEYNITGSHERYLTVPFYNTFKKKVEYIPKNISALYYGSNGMSAGNTIEEAIVQGLSEIIERYVQKRLFLEKPTLPDIPDNYIRKYPYVYEMWHKLKSSNDDKYVFMLKDCSFGGIYPVAALFIVEKNTGRYGVKLGCHPDYGIAMERTFTEATQGQDIFEYTSRSKLDFYNRYVEDSDNITNSYKLGLGQFPYQLFGACASFEFKPVKDVACMSNKELAQNWIMELNKAGHEVCIRNVSYFGFSSVHILIPGMSEMQEIDDKRLRAYNTRSYASYLLNNVEKIDKSNTKYLIGALGYFMKASMENTLEVYYLHMENPKVPCREFYADSLYLMAMCHIIEEDYMNAYKKMELVEERAQIYCNSSEEKELIHAIKLYCAAMDQLKNFDDAISYLNVFFDEKICRYIENTFKNPSDVIIKQYPSSDELALLRNNEGYKSYSHFIDEYIKVQGQVNINQQSIGEVLELEEAS
ncbi:YcaO-like family protein [Butyrivibrio sp. MC2013]|uniref:YcaO-like family protein n=1 Tax=Butyrivibrio sp. MC2013 TaxID=1280686 RepID=UPI0004292678|nr:YcaO-like family protein [Butyrivibrio sp. MC2013]